MTSAEWRRAVETRLGRKMTRSERQCLGKRSYTENQARGQAACSRQEGSKRYRAYKCKICSHWHVGRKKIR